MNPKKAGLRKREQRGKNKIISPDDSLTSSSSNASNIEKRLKTAHSLLARAYRGELGEMASAYMNSLPSLTPPVTTTPATSPTELSPPTPTPPATTSTVLSPPIPATTPTVLSPPIPATTPTVLSPPIPATTPTVLSPPIPTPPATTPAVPSPPIAPTASKPVPSTSLELPMHSLDSYAYNQKHHVEMFHPPSGPTHYPSHPQMAWAWQQTLPPAYYPVPQNPRPSRYHQNRTVNQQVNQFQAWKQYLNTKYMEYPQTSKNKIKKHWTLDWFLSRQKKY